MVGFGRRGSGLGRRRVLDFFLERVGFAPNAIFILCKISAVIIGIWGKKKILTKQARASMMNFS